LERQIHKKAGWVGLGPTSVLYALAVEKLALPQISDHRSKSPTVGLLLVKIESCCSWSWACTDRGKKKLLMKWGLLIAAWRVLAGFLAKECSSGNNWTGMFPFHLSDHNRTVSPMATSTKARFLYLSKSLTISRHQKDPFLFCPGNFPLP
jgi:hypothetical protein